MGKVYLVGAGPGDPELLTLKARRLLEQADVVVYDRLVGPGVLELVPPRTARIDVGKNAGDHPVPQGRINEILAQQARQHGCVVRLKGGDSFVFGRGGEELLYLLEQNIPFEVVPGVTSALAAPAYAGIPVTHRDCCSSVHIITGHRRENGRLELDYPALVRLDGTLVFLMSVASAGQIAAGLLEAGMAPDMPCAVVQNGTLPSQRKLLSTLSALEGDLRDSGIVSPAVIVVGRVCALSPRLDWFSALPLKGRRILVTRPAPRAPRLAGLLRRLGAEVTTLPAIETVPLDFALPDLKEFTLLVFTSAEGVDVCFDRLFQSGDARQFAGKRFAAIGRATAAALLRRGIRADLVPAEYSGAALGALLTAPGVLGPADRLLLLRARAATPQLAEILSARGVPFAQVDLYDTLYRPMPQCDPARYDLLTFTSASCVEGYTRAAAGFDLRGVPALCIGAQTAAAAAARGMAPVLSSQATIDSMVEAACHYFGKEVIPS